MSYADMIRKVRAGQWVLEVSPDLEFEARSMFEGFLIPGSSMLSNDIYIDRTLIIINKHLRSGIMHMWRKEKV